MPWRRSSSSTRSCFCRIRPIATGSTNSKWLGLKHSETWIRCPLTVLISFECPRWYFTSPRPMCNSGSMSANSRNTCCGALAHYVDQHIQPATVSHGEHNFFYFVLAGTFDRQLQERDQRFSPFERKTFAPRNRRWINSSKTVALVRPFKMRS